MRRIFRFLNKYFMVPIFRLGLGFFFGNPLTSYVMVLKTTGRKTGKQRYSPVNYAIQDGNVYCVSGFRQDCDWYRNLRNQPAIEIILPGGAISGMAGEISNPAIRRIVIRKILQNAGFAGFFEGFNPFRISDEDLAARTADMPLICIQPTGLGTGAGDPGGWAWVWTPVSLLLLAFILWLFIR